MEKQWFVKYGTVLPLSRMGTGKKAVGFWFRRTPMASDVSGKVANGQSHGSAAVAATRAYASYASHADDDSPSDENWSS